MVDRRMFLSGASAFTLGLTAAGESLALTFQEFLARVGRDALAMGISQKTIDIAFAGVTENPKVIRLDRRQPEGTITFAKYQENVLPKFRIDAGRKRLRDHADLLAKVSATYDVQPQYIVSLWGMETGYGAFTGGFDVVRSLATLAYDGRRAAFFRSELMHALKILEDGHIDRPNFKGSWAGAMGQSQFMPSSFMRLAVDFDGDGKQDIWNSLPDVFGSAANYLSKVGWNGQEYWGQRVYLPSNVEFVLDEFQPPAYWVARGIMNEQGQTITPKLAEAKLVRPGKNENQYFLVGRNYDVILDWNRSKYFATSVGMLADAISS